MRPMPQGTSAKSEGQQYLDTVPLERRRATGQVYTPRHLADFVLEQAGFDRADNSATLLDPACGAGIFLECAVTMLAKVLMTGRNENMDRHVGTALQNAVEEQLFGIDIDETACEMTRNLVRRAVEKHAGVRVRKSFFHANVVCTDFLFDDFMRIGTDCKRFSFIVGNPPYVATTRLSSTYKQRLRSSFDSASGRIDLYAVFMEKSLALLSRGGRLALLTPDKFLVSQSARSLRALLLHRNALLTVARFRSHKVFSDAATVPCVTVVERGGQSGNTTILSCGERPDEQGRVAVLERRHLSQKALSHLPWHLHALDRHELARQLQGSHPTLAQRTVRVSAGPATGRDDVFVFPRGAHPDIEETLIRPIVRGRDLQAFRIEDPGRDMLVPYTFDANGDSSLIELADFPGARRYLRGHRAELEKRHCVRVWGKRWYDLHDQMTTDLARQPKILVPDIANSNRFVVDHGRFLPLHSVYYLIPRNRNETDYLCAVLNSRVACFLIKLFSPLMKDGFNRYRQQFLAALPVPLVTDQQARDIARAASAGHTEAVDERIARLFKLDLEQYKGLEVLENENGTQR